MDTIKGYFSIDIGFGDTITNGPYEIEFPVLLDFPSPKILVYSLESAVAEKFEAIVKLNFVTSRMKDFFDLWILCTNYKFDGKSLTLAVKNTFERRKTPIPPENPVALSLLFVKNVEKQEQWKAFLNRGISKEKHCSLEETIKKLQNFLLPVLDCLRSMKAFQKSWSPEKGWE